MMNPKIQVMIAASVVLVASGISPAGAGGDDYDMSKSDVAVLGPAYFGFVRDNRGSPVTDAQVLLQPKKGKPVSLTSNAIGLYRGHLRKDVLPDDVQVSCMKTGYKQLKVNRRTPPGNASMFIQTECTMQRL